MIVQVRCEQCGLNDNIEVESIEKIKDLTCEVCHGALKLVQEIATIKLNNLTILKPENVELTFSVEEIEQFPTLKSGKYELPKGIRLLPHNPLCKLKESWCIEKNGKKMCLRQVHEKPEKAAGIEYKPLFNIEKCELEEQKEIEETEGYEVEK